MNTPDISSIKSSPTEFPRWFWSLNQKVIPQTRCFGGGVCAALTCSFLAGMAVANNVVERGWGFWTCLVGAIVTAIYSLRFGGFMQEERYAHDHWMNVLAGCVSCEMSSTQLDELEQMFYRHYNSLNPEMRDLFRRILVQRNRLSVTGLYI